MRFTRVLAVLTLAFVAACGSSNGNDEEADDTTSSAGTDPPSAATPVETEPPESDPVETEPTEAEPLQTDPIDSEPREADQADGAATDVGAARMDLELVECEQMAIQAPVSMEQAQTLVPDGVELFVDDDGMANYTHVAKTCGDMLVDGMSVGGGHFDTQWIRITGPEDIREFPEYPNHMVLPGDLFHPIGFATDNEALRDAVAAFGVPMRLATSMEMDPIAPGPQTGTVVVDDGGYSWTTDNVAEEGLDVYFVHVLEQADEGFVLRYDITCPATVVYFQNASTITFDEGSPAAEAFGPELVGDGYAVELTCDVEIERVLDVERTAQVAYTESRSLDVYAPVDGDDLPVVVFFHGGLGDSRQPSVTTTAAQVAAQGVVVYVPQWRAIGPSGGSEDTVCALAFAESTAGEYGGDGERITISGYSTGGFTAAVHALMADDPPLEVTDCLVDPAPSLPSAAVPGGTPFFAVDAARAGLFADNPQWNTLTPEQLDAFDPYLLLGRNPDIRMVLVVGRVDTGGGALGEIPIAQSNREYHAALLDAGYDADLIELAGGHELTPGTPKFERWVNTIATVAMNAD